ETVLLPGDTFTLFGAGFDLAYLDNHSVVFATADGTATASVLGVFADRLLIEVPADAVTGDVAVSLASVDPPSTQIVLSSIHVVRPFSISSLALPRTSGVYLGELVTVTLSIPVRDVAIVAPTATVDDLSATVVSVDPLRIEIPAGIETGNQSLCVTGDLGEACTSVAVLGPGHTDLLRAPGCAQIDIMQAGREVVHEFPFFPHENYTVSPSRTFFVLDDELDTVHVAAAGDRTFEYAGSYPLLAGGDYDRLVAHAGSGGGGGYLAVHRGDPNDPASPGSIVIASLLDVVPVAEVTLPLSLEHLLVVDSFHVAVLVTGASGSEIALVDVRTPPASLTSTPMAGTVLGITARDPVTAAHSQTWTGWLAMVTGGGSDRLVFVDFDTAAETIALGPSPGCGTSGAAGTCPPFGAFRRAPELTWVNGTQTALYLDREVNSSLFNATDKVYFLRFSGQNISKAVRMQDEHSCTLCMGRESSSLPAVSGYDTSAGGHWVVHQGKPVSTLYGTYIALIKGALDTYLDQASVTTVTLPLSNFDNTGVDGQALYDLPTSATAWIGPSRSGATRLSVLYDSYGVQIIELPLAGGAMQPPSVRPAISLPVETATVAASDTALAGMTAELKLFSIDLVTARVLIESQPTFRAQSVVQWRGTDRFGVLVSPYGRYSQQVRPQLLFDSLGRLAPAFDYYGYGSVVPYQGHVGQAVSVALSDDESELLRIPFDGQQSDFAAQSSVTVTPVAETCYDPGSGDPLDAPDIYLGLSTDQVDVFGACYEDLAAQACAYDDPSNPSYINPNYSGTVCEAASSLQDDLCRRTVQLYLWPSADTATTSVMPTTVGLCGQDARAVGLVPSQAASEDLLVWAVGHPPRVTQADLPPCVGLCIFRYYPAPVVLASLLNTGGTSPVNLTASRSGSGLAAIALSSEDEVVVGGDGLNDYRLRDVHPRILRDPLHNRWIYAVTSGDTTEVRAIRGTDLGVSMLLTLTNTGALDIQLSPDAKRIYVLGDDGRSIRVLENLPKPVYRGQSVLPGGATVLRVTQDGSGVVAPADAGFCLVTD
ncbi:MAG: hypothetical protein AAB426_03755, partial [Myxococcota bacterium]